MLAYAIVKKNNPKKINILDIYSAKDIKAVSLARDEKVVKVTITLRK